MVLHCSIPLFFSVMTGYVLIAPDGKVVQWMADDPDTFDLYFDDNIITKE